MRAQTAPPVLLLMAAALVAAAPRSAGAQAGADRPVVRPPAVPAGPARGSKAAASGAHTGALPLDPDARGLVPLRSGDHERRDRKRSRRPFFVPVVLPFFGPGAPFLRPREPVFGHRTAFGHGARVRGPAPPADRTPQRDAGRSPTAGEPSSSSMEEAVGSEGHPSVRTRGRPEGPCFEVVVRMEGGRHRLRIDGASLGAGTAGQAERKLRRGMRSAGTLRVEGLDGVSLHLSADRVRGLAAEPCPAVTVLP